MLHNKDFEDFIKRMSLLTGIPECFFERLQLVGYTDEQMHYGIHHDSATCKANGRRRVDPKTNCQADCKTAALLHPNLIYEDNHLIQVPMASTNENVAKRSRSSADGVQYIGGTSEPYRIFTCLVYLNSLQKKHDGCTHFPWAVCSPADESKSLTEIFDRSQGSNFRPIANSAAIWSNVATNEQGEVVTDPRVIHSAMRLKGKAPSVMKFAINVWAGNQSDPRGKEKSHGKKRRGASAADGNMRRKTPSVLSLCHYPTTEQEMFCEVCGGCMNSWKEENKLSPGEVVLQRRSFNGDESLDSCLPHKVCYEFCHEDSGVMTPSRAERDSDLILCDFSENSKKHCDGGAICLNCYNRCYSTVKWPSVEAYLESDSAWFCHRHREILGIDDYDPVVVIYQQDIDEFQTPPNTELCSRPYVGLHKRCFKH
eukprot:GHVQ01038999.1.p1 GENE.GHVQ01038999.1~~GHVQ01038999.1.p1  ORF type:complete len:426 (+),score=37.99 GHVQ01038999.1:890-2167(+)